MHSAEPEPRGRALGQAAAAAMRSRPLLEPSVAEIIREMGSAPDAWDAADRRVAAWSYGKDLARAWLRLARTGGTHHACGLLRGLDPCTARRIGCVLAYLQGVAEECPQARGAQLVDIWETGFASEAALTGGASDRMSPEETSSVDRAPAEEPGAAEARDSDRWGRRGVEACGRCRRTGGCDCPPPESGEDALGLQPRRSAVAEDDGRPASGWREEGGDVAAGGRQSYATHATSYAESGTQESAERRREAEGEAEEALVSRVYALALHQARRHPRWQKRAPAEKTYRSPRHNRIEVGLLPFHKHPMQSDVRPRDWCQAPGCRKQQGTFFACQLSGCGFSVCNACWKRHTLVKYVDRPEGEQDSALTRVQYIALQVWEAVHKGNRTMFNEHVRDIATFWRACDQDGSGEVDKQEFVEGLRRLDVAAPDYVISDFVGLFDVNGDGKLDIAEMSRAFEESFAAVRAQVKIKT